MVKKILLALLAATMMYIQPAQGAAMNVVKQLLMVPWVHYNTNVTTAVGVGSRRNGNVYWAFFDVNGNRRASGQFAVTEFSSTPFVWSAQAAASGQAGLNNLHGYLLFGLDTNGDATITGSDSCCISGNAFYVDLSANDVAYVPTLGFGNSHLSKKNTAQWTSHPIADLPNHEGWAVDTGSFAMLSYLMDGTAGGDDTRFYVWTVQRLGTTQSVTVHDGAGSSKVISVQILNDHLNVLDPETHPDIDASFYPDGFVRWQFPKASDGVTDAQAFMFSIVSSDTFMASQTMMANITE